MVSGLKTSRLKNSQCSKGSSSPYSLGMGVEERRKVLPLEGSLDIPKEKPPPPSPVEAAFSASA